MLKTIGSWSSPALKLSYRIWLRELLVKKADFVLSKTLRRNFPCWLAGIVLLVSALLKGYELSISPTSSEGIRLPRAVLNGLVNFELSFGGWLLCGFYPIATRYAAVGCFTVFGFVSLTRAIAGDASCGCFGLLEVSPWITFAFDVTVVVTMLYWKPVTETSTNYRSHPRRAARLFGLVALFFIASTLITHKGPTVVAPVINYFMSGEDLVVLEPEQWVGMYFPLLNHIDIGSQLSDGRWVVLLYHHDCSSCRDSIPKYVRMADLESDQQSTLQVALIEVPPYASPAHRIVDYDASYVSGRLSDSVMWFVTTPSEIILEDGIVRTCKVGQTPVTLP